MRNNRMTMIALAGAAALTLSSCRTAREAKDGTQAGNGSDVTVGMDGDTDSGYLILSDAQRSMVRGSNAFGLKLFKQTMGMDSRVISPLSVTYLMSMLANGADGQTRQEILDVLGWGSEGQSLDDINAMQRMMIERAGNMDKQVSVSIANYIAVNRQFTLDSKFQRAMQQDYHAGVESMDFASPKSVKRINDWCSRQTHGMIPGIIDQTEPDAVSYIMNAIYFNGSWTDKFDKKETRLEPFRGYTRDVKRVQMMHRNDKYLYTDNDVFSAVNIPYGDGPYRMTVYLPGQGKSVDDLLDVLTADTMDSLSWNMKMCQVDLKLPRFTTELELPLNSIIASLGAPSMFQPTANFSHFASGSFYVSKMLQKAKIEVSEEGTKAAAVTAAIMVMSALNPDEPRRVNFHADHPFLYTITERGTGAVLFMGQYAGD